MSWENNPPARLGTVAEVEVVVGRPASMIMRKQVGALDEGCADLLARSPIAGFGYRGADGASRTTFVGGTPGFARVHSPGRISFPLCEAADGPASLVFLLPGVGETLRVNGVARGGGFDVGEVYVHCAQSVLRSGLWQPPGDTPAAPEVGDGPLALPGVADFLAAAPFLVLSTWDSRGGSDTSPRGDQPTVARIVDGRTLLIADRRGNKRADTLRNLLEDDRLSFAALVPGRTGVLHVRGRAVITVDPGLLEPLALRGVPPHAALLVDVEDAVLSANDAVTRARLWTSATPDDVPDLMALASRHLAANSASGGPRGFLLKIAGRIPARWMRAIINVAYRSGLRKEGYEVAAVRPSAATEDPLREVRVAEVRHETPSAVTLVLEDDQPFDFRPGQFFTLVADVGGARVRRPYSASSAPGSRRLEITIKQVGRFSRHVRTLVAGDRLFVRGPSGTFHAEPGHEVVLLAAGSGVTPMMSIIRTLLAEPGDRIFLLYSNRTAEETIFAADLVRLVEQHPDRLAVTHVLTAHDGRLDVPRVRKWAADLTLSPSARFYLCGPEPLMDTARQALDELGVPGDRVHAESYTNASMAAGSVTPQRMLVQRDGNPVGTAVVEPGQTLLDAALAAGLPMPYSCTVGSCQECVAKLLAGKVSRQGEDGQVLTCTSAPLTDVTLEI
ncbi:2Fe-2S iron-sulfur cluster-binding protein [Lentzea sp. BCCO 10_0798]|uniref:2Fe-2S iron-sulfur cluster-binding protein n=1 Tax=Lentzea kristufekii TaxID=3095430 RepID=A0ABU4TVB7_9PSEU|nr:2Fe-2S iron-sulfur cluster-binding protein [Lentzea sp. BCCO 10_0798]MDX8052248.1 2Fe-2S iron-sulfur cluster-binding protein [Lentzea sp. BCCO 10_0798]